MEKNILVYRFSSFGDVLITLPVMLSLLKQYPETHLFFYTKKEFVQFFPSHQNLTVTGVDFKEYAGLFGLYALFKQIYRQQKFAAAIDLHGVVRTFTLNLFFRLSGIPVYSIDKHRLARKKFIKGIDRRPLPPITHLYADAFHRAGFHFSLLPPPYYPGTGDLLKYKDNCRFTIGISPFAKHATKTWPMEYFRELMQYLDTHLDVGFYIFCSQSELEFTGSLEARQITRVAEWEDPGKELLVLQGLDVMISLDSANMHLADAAGIPVVSIWGGTHPDMGFKPVNQPEEYIVESEEYFACRPCSVYGRKDCVLKDRPFACLTTISPRQVANVVFKALKQPIVYH